jgi:hypothetical protein
VCPYGRRTQSIKDLTLSQVDILSGSLVSTTRQDRRREKITAQFETG